LSFTRFEAFTVVKIHVEVFWVVTPCNVYGRRTVVPTSIFRVNCTLKMEAAWTSETLHSTPILLFKCYDCVA
jgi:hypothetical protein